MFLSGVSALDRHFVLGIFNFSSHIPLFGLTFFYLDFLLTFLYHLFFCPLQTELFNVCFFFLFKLNCDFFSFGRAGKKNVQQQSFGMGKLCWSCHMIQAMLSKRYGALAFKPCSPPVPSLPHPITTTKKLPMLKCKTLLQIGNPLRYTCKDDFHDSSYKTKCRLKKTDKSLQFIFYLHLTLVKIN